LASISIRLVPDAPVTNLPVVRVPVTVKLPAVSLVIEQVDILASVIVALAICAEVIVAFTILAAVIEASLIWAVPIFSSLKSVIALCA
jgi:hypothetical protein